MARLCVLVALALGSLSLSAQSAKVVAGEDSPPAVVTLDEYPTATSLNELQYQAGLSIDFGSSSGKISTFISPTMTTISSGVPDAAKEAVIEGTEGRTILGVEEVVGTEVAGLQSHCVNSMSAEESTSTETNIDEAASKAMASTTDIPTNKFFDDEGASQNDNQTLKTLMALHTVPREPSLQQNPDASMSITPVARGESFSTTVMGTHPTCMSNGIAFDCGPTPTHPSPDNPFPTATIYRPNPADTSRFRDLSCSPPSSSLGVAKKVIEAEIQKVCSSLGRIWDPRTDGDGNTITHDGVLPGGKKYELFAMFTQPGNTAVDFSTPVCTAGFLMPFENCKANKDGLFRGGWVTLGLGKGGRESDVLFKVRADWPPKVERRSVDQAEVLQVAKGMEPKSLSAAVHDLPEDSVCNATAPASVTTASTSL
ncbi:hypothetical protein KC343_g3237 [Hortaea werneckii]|nr:hypothetical protein KC352_g16065 [Hortaea werneckii]KAI7565922.1 hypothetical protein KC317_g6026 [Hortaea werneckii]KAI7622124.1 hypothetical protein KC346_g3358 [Hortaea werneckii]KAI7632878.1 hypothetical protein KC343_g3237 [Hortaea werneckii]KAI7678856.1 hypothetical protein KC319_g3084 [Hortaea werneckii]